MLLALAIGFSLDLVPAHSAEVSKMSHPPARPSRVNVTAASISNSDDMIDMKKCTRRNGTAVLTGKSITLENLEACSTAYYLSDHFRLQQEGIEGVRPTGRQEGPRPRAFVPRSNLKSSLLSF
jgi:hypothetical protein